MKVVLCFLEHIITFPIKIISVHNNLSVHWIWTCNLFIPIKNPFEDWAHFLVIHVSVNGNSKIVEVKNKTPEEIEHWVERLRHESGVKVQKIRKFWHTENPSIQGTWTPFLNKPPSLRRSAVSTLTAQSKFSSWLGEWGVTVKSW